MKTTRLFIFGAMALAMASCSTSKDNNTEADESTETTFVAVPYTGSIAGEWKVTDIEMYDTLSLKPAEINPEEPTTVMFTDSTYHFRTNCNLVQGNYTQSGDTITFSNGLSTRMACRDMRIEDTLNKLLPQLTTIGAENDSTLRFIADNPSAYIVVTKMK